MAAPIPPIAPRKELAMRIAPIICDMLRRVDPDDLIFHARRYDSGEAFRALLIAAHTLRYIDPDTLRAYISTIAANSVDDGAEWGTIPCLGGYARDVWLVCLAFHSFTSDTKGA